jgi:alcohol dehydrogenase class IV
LTVELESIIPLTMARLKFGVGATEELGYELKALGARKVLLVTDRRLWEHGLVDRVKTIIEREKIALAIFDEVHCEPTDASMRHAIDKANGLSFDAIVALGGGSAIDTAKAVNLYHTYPADLHEYINAPIGKGKPVPGPLKPLIALPTTSGSGSETTTVIVLDLLEMQLKTGISHQLIRPTVALVDPLNTLSAPPAVTAATGLDVLTHAAESFTIKPYNVRPKPKDPSLRPPYIGANPIADLWSEKAIEWGGTYLRRAYYNGSDLEAKSHMAMAATFAGIGFGNAGVHIPHALAYPIAARIKGWVPPGYGTEEPMVPHGLSVALTAAANFRFTAPSHPEKHARIALLLGVNTAGLSEWEAAMKLPEAFIRLMKDIGAPNGLGAIGYTEADIPALVEGGLKQQRLLVGSPRPVTGEDLTRIVEESMKLW